MVTFKSLFCGAGGDAQGLTEAGFELVLAANHWPRAIETHAANFPAAEHLCADINNTDMRRLPATDVLWASPICTEGTPAGGNAGRRSNRMDGQLPIEAFGHVEQAGFERTRATFHDVIRATEIHRYKVVLVENVPDVAWRWELFDWWCQGMIRLGYRMQIVCATSAHLGGEGNEPAAQWRDRLYLCFTRDGIPAPDLTVNPSAWCEKCQADVVAVQTWKPGTMRILGHPVGKYRSQYSFTCPRGHATVEPYVVPASAVIDWSKPGKRIGDRRKPLADTTMQRIEAGLAKFPLDRTVLTVNHSGHDGRAFPADLAPLPTRTVKIGDGLLVPCGGNWNTTAAWTGDPMRTRMANPKGYEGLVSAPFVVEYRNHADASPVTAPLATLTAQGRHHALVIPYRRASPSTTDHPLHTLATKDSAALVTPHLNVEDCHFRMLQPREHLRGQRFPADYIVTGNGGEQTMQAGNAVSVNAAHWLGTRVMTALA
jgi:DNA (cytosine-5)-methyltransferase 1